MMLDASGDIAAPSHVASQQNDRTILVDEIRVIGGVIWELVGKSLGRMILIFVTVFLASFLPAALLILGLTLATQTYTRAGLFIVVTLCLVPLAAMAGFNYVAYRGLSDIVKKMAIVQMIGAAFIAFLEPTGRMRLPLSEVTDRLKVFLKKTRAEAEAKTDSRGLRKLFFRATTKAFFLTIRFAIHRIAKGCVVDGEVDLEKLAIAIADRADGLLVSYFKKILWDLTRIVITLTTIVICGGVYVAIILINLLP